jgi:glycosyltransferase involved in cell wall biosynthesis
VQREVPEAKIHVVGANAAKEVARLASDRVIFHGRVPDLPPYYRQAAIVVVPVLHGGGTRQQILEAAASGKAIVSTSRGAEGLEFRPGEDLLVADEPAAFASAVIRLLRNEGQRRLLGQRARRLCLRYEWERIGAHFCHTIENLVKPVSQNRPHGLGRLHGKPVHARADSARVMQ